MNMNLDNITYPLVHPHGSSRLRLEEVNREAAIVLDNALRAMALASPHERDYYPLGPEAFEKATAEFQQVYKAVKVAKDYFEAIALGLGG